MPSLKMKPIRIKRAVDILIEGRRKKDQSTRKQIEMQLRCLRALGFKLCDRGVICYKIFGLWYVPPSKWDIRRGSIITEKVDCNIHRPCAPGINVATKRWYHNSVQPYQLPKFKIWKCLILWEDFKGMVVPADSRGKIRCNRLKIVQIEQHGKDGDRMERL